MAWIQKMSSMDANIMIDCADPNFLFDGHIHDPSSKPTSRDFFFFQRELYQMWMPISTKQLPPLEERPSSSEKVGEVACEVSLSQSKQFVKSCRRKSPIKGHDSTSQLTSHPPPSEACGSLFAAHATGAVY
jgi:hypothetical protein